MALPRTRQTETFPGGQRCSTFASAAWRRPQRHSPRARPSCSRGARVVAAARRRPRPTTPTRRSRSTSPSGATTSAPRSTTRRSPRSTRSTRTSRSTPPSSASPSSGRSARPRRPVAACPTSCSSTTPTSASTRRTGCCSTSSPTSATSSTPSRSASTILQHRRRRRRDHRHPDLHQRVGPLHEHEAARPGRRRGVRGRQLGGLHRVGRRGIGGRRRRDLGRHRLHRPHPELRDPAARQG